MYEILKDVIFMLFGRKYDVSNEDQVTQFKSVFKRVNTLLKNKKDISRTELLELLLEDGYNEKVASYAVNNGEVDWFIYAVSKVNALVKQDDGFTKEEIMDQVKFQEQYFKSEVRMSREFIRGLARTIKVLASFFALSQDTIENFDIMSTEYSPISTHKYKSSFRGKRKIP